MGLTLAVDFDRTLVEPGRPLRWRPHAREVLLALKERAGHTLVLHSCRCNPAPAGNPSAARAEADEFWRTGETSAARHWEAFEEMRAFLKAEGCWDLFDAVWQGAGKPDADAYLDDRAEVPISWLDVWRERGVE